MLIIFICADLVLSYSDCSVALHLFAAKIFTIIKRRVEIINRMNSCTKRQHFVDGSPEIAQIEKKRLKLV